MPNTYSERNLLDFMCSVQRHRDAYNPQGEHAIVRGTQHRGILEDNEN